VVRGINFEKDWQVTKEKVSAPTSKLDKKKKRKLTTDLESDSTAKRNKKTPGN